MSAELTLRDVDALELAELLEFLRDFFASQADAIGPVLPVETGQSIRARETGCAVFPVEAWGAIRANGAREG